VTSNTRVRIKIDVKKDKIKFIHPESQKELSRSIIPLGAYKRLFIWGSENCKASVRLY